MLATSYTNSVILVPWSYGPAEVWRLQSQQCWATTRISLVFCKTVSSDGPDNLHKLAFTLRMVKCPTSYRSHTPGEGRQDVKRFHKRKALQASLLSTNSCQLQRQFRLLLPTIRGTSLPGLLFQKKERSSLAPRELAPGCVSWRWQSGQHTHFADAPLAPSPAAPREAAGAT